MRVLAALLFATAAAASALGGAGLVVVPHDEPAGADPMHEHSVTVFRFPVLLIGEVPGVPHAADLAHHVRSAHQEHLRALLGIGGPSIGPVHPLAELAGTTVLALLALAVPRLARPTRIAVADVPFPRVIATQWRFAPSSPPPRRPVFVMF